MSKISDVLSILKRRDFIIPLDTDGDRKYKVITLDKEHVSDMSEKLEQQLKQEGKYGWYITVFSSNPETSEMDLPIFGDSNKFVTKWLFSDYEDAVQQDLRDRSINLYNRIMRFEENKDYIQ